MAALGYEYGCAGLRLSLIHILLLVIGLLLMSVLALIAFLRYKILRSKHQYHEEMNRMKMCIRDSPAGVCRDSLLNKYRRIR